MLVHLGGVSGSWTTFDVDGRGRRSVVDERRAFGACTSADIPGIIPDEWVLPRMSMLFIAA